jgi:hypothetical protein
VNHLRTTPTTSLADEVASYAADFELQRIGILAGCPPRQPNAAMEHLWLTLYKAAPWAGRELGELIGAHRSALHAFKDGGYTLGAPSARAQQARHAHYAALAALCERVARGAHGTGRTRTSR